jgi:hypothetical protein
VDEQVTSVGNNQLVSLITEANAALNGYLREAGRRGLLIDSYPMENGTQVISVYRRTQIIPAGPSVVPDEQIAAEESLNGN